MTVVVISQPMLFPWVGLLEQLRLCDIWVHYDDVQFSKGSFFNRVQIKTERGPAWMTIPLRDVRLGRRIREIEIAPDRDWRSSHIDLLAQAYARAPFLEEMLDLVRGVYQKDAGCLSEATIPSFETLADYFGLLAGRRVLCSSHLGVGGEGSQRVLDLVRSLDGSVYVTGHGARNYLDHEAFVAAGIEVRYMDYRKTPYPQQHGAFNPYVTALDLVANLGREGHRFIMSPAVAWKEFLGWMK